MVEDKLLKSMGVSLTSCGSLVENDVVPTHRGCSGLSIWFGGMRVLCSVYRDRWCCGMVMNNTVVVYGCAHIPSFLARDFDAFILVF